MSMLSNRLAPYIFFSILIHFGLLLGIHSFIRLPDTQSEQSLLIPVEIAVQRVTVSKPVVTKQQDSTVQSQLAGDLVEGKGSDDIADPMPAEGSYYFSENTQRNILDRVMQVAEKRLKGTRQLEITLSQATLPFFPADGNIYEKIPSPAKSDSTPRFAVTIAPALRIPLMTPKADEADSESVILAITEPPLSLVAVEPSPPPGSTPIYLSISGSTAGPKAAESQDYTPKVAKVINEPVNLVTEESFSLPLAAVKPSPPSGSTPIDMSISGGTAGPKAAESQDYTPKVAKIINEPVNLVTGESFPLSLAAVKPSLSVGSTSIDIGRFAEFAEVNGVVRSHLSHVPHKAVASMVEVQFEDDFAAKVHPLPTQVEGEPRLLASNLQINSSPEGAQVYVDGLLSGDTPLSLELTPGKHEVRLTLPDHYDWKAQVDLSEINRSYPLSLRLLPVE